ncbi:hypothetical protein GWI33_020021 [Rhynchophorus ferrugineus]|uniref:Uncharacterized protein n=1 Tax=Rhynchophorus ferrugineus TaxID=354439 RepID=A0A834HT89_RHYFE|nr:hypothetical protein GWI33_020021 [Rhynchophorus ferrugineus]
MSSVHESAKNLKSSSEETTMNQKTQFVFTGLKNKLYRRKPVLIQRDINEEQLQSLTFPSQRKRLYNTQSHNQAPDGNTNVFERLYCRRCLPSESTVESVKKQYEHKKKAMEKRRELYSILKYPHKLGPRFSNTIRPITSPETVMGSQSISEPPTKKVCQHSSTYIAEFKTPTSRRILFDSNSTNQEDDEGFTPSKLEDSSTKENNNQTGYDSGLECHENNEAAKTLEARRKSKQAINNQLQLLIDMLKDIKIELNKPHLGRSILSTESQE